jgi:hypothetical protein
MSHRDEGDGSHTAESANEVVVGVDGSYTAINSRVRPPPGNGPQSWGP